MRPDMGLKFQEVQVCCGAAAVAPAVETTGLKN